MIPPKTQGLELKMSKARRVQKMIAQHGFGGQETFFSNNKESIVTKWGGQTIRKVDTRKLGFVFIRYMLISRQFHP